MEIKININENCKHCKKVLNYFKSLQKLHKNHYMNMNMKNYTFLDGIYLTPDYNASGHLTNFHLERASLKNLKSIILSIETQKIESKKIIKIKKEEKKDVR